MLCGRPTLNVLFINAVYGCDLPVSNEFTQLVPECGKDMIGVTPHPIHSMLGQIYKEERYDAE